MKAGRRPDILVISPVVPMAQGNGMAMRIGSHVRALAGIGRLRLAAVDPDGLLQGPACAEFRALAATVSRLPSPEEGLGRIRAFRQTSGRLAQLWRALVLPAEAAVPFSAAESSAMVEALAGSRPDIIVCLRLAGAILAEPALRRLGWSDVPLIVDFDDIESRAHLRRLRTQRRDLGLIHSLWLALQILRLRRLEGRLLRIAHTVIICSEDDRKVLEARRPRARIAVIPNTVVLPTLPAASGAQQDEGDRPFTVLFVGTMNYLPNEAGILWFAREVWPLVVARLGREHCRLVIVGRLPGERVHAQGSGEHIVVTGEVPDVEPFYRTADLVIAPIHAGGGTRIKILEALGYARAVVTTTIGTEGIPVQDGVTARLADTPADFAAAILDLAQDRAARTRLGAEGRKLIEGQFGPEAAARQWIVIAAGADRAA